MRFDEALYELAFSKTALFSVAGAAAALSVAGAVALWPGDDEPSAADAVTVSGPIFKPVAMTAPIPIAAVNPNTRPGDSFATPPPDDTVLVRNIQLRLAKARCYDGAMSGIWSTATRRGMAEFTHKANARLPVGRPAPELLSLLEQNADIACGADCMDGGSCTPREITRPRSEEIATADPAPPPAAAADPDAAAMESPDAPGVAPGMEKSATAEPRRAYRKYKRKPSFVRQVNKGFRQLQRTLNKLF